MAATMAGHVAELVFGISGSVDTTRLRSFRSESLTEISAVRTKVARGAVKFGVHSSSRRLSWRSVGSFPSSAQSCRDRITVAPPAAAAATAAGLNGEAGGEKEGFFTKDELLMLRKKASDISSHLQGSSIFLVGMSKSGKSTVGRCLSEALGYYFFDSQQLVEQAAGDQFREMVDEEVENAETEVLMQLSPLVRLIVATGERAVTKPRNWGYLRHGVTVWLHWPVDSLVQRMTTDSESAPDKVLENTRKALQERANFYGNADATVSIEKIAALKDIEDFTSITPPMVAFHVLDEIDRVLKKADKSRL